MIPHLQKSKLYPYTTLFRSYSSAKIVRENEGTGLTIDIVTRDNITEVTDEMYANALLTAGVEDATVEVASPVKVRDRKSTRLNSSHVAISYAVFCLKKKTTA